MKKISPKTLSRCGMTAALYTVVSIVLLPVSFGAIQIRAAEALTLLPVLTPTAVAGVTLGCAITNAYGVAMGANLLGVADIVIGSLATFIGAVMTRALRNVRIKGLAIPSSVPPIIINALFIGAELSFVQTNSFFSPLFWINAAQVAAGQLLSCSVFGVMLTAFIERSGLCRRLFE